MTDAPSGVVTFLFTDLNGSTRPPSPASTSVPLTATAFPEIGGTINHLREVLGEQADQSLAATGEAMTVAAMTTYAYDEINYPRTGLSG